MSEDLRRRSTPDAVPAQGRGRITLLSLIFLAFLLLLPCIALSRRVIDLRWIAAYEFIIAVLTYGAYALDKHRARTNAWRLPEALLHALELLGGWPGAFLAQRRLRHKCSKMTYQVVFWFIVLVYQFAALDCLQHWQLSRAAWNRLPLLSDHRK